MVKVRKACARCKVDMGMVYPARKYCSDCLKPIATERVRIYRKAHPEKGPVRPLQIISCADCGIDFVASRCDRKRCPDCRDVKNQCFHAIKRIRREMFTKSLVTPEEARGIVEDMLKEEGKEFTELMVNGLMSRILKKE